MTLSNGETIETSEHPFYVVGRGFVKAGELGIGSSIVTRAGPSLALRAATAGKAQTVYNFEVADYHTYFVGQGEVWVHNAWCGNWSSTSVPTWGHSFTTHGHRKKKNLIGRAATEGQPQGMWLNNDEAAALLKSHLEHLDPIPAKGSTIEISIPAGSGQIVRADGTTSPASRARIVFSDGERQLIKTAFPIE